MKMIRKALILIIKLLTTIAYYDKREPLVVAKSYQYLTPIYIGDRYSWSGVNQGNYTVKRKGLNGIFVQKDGTDVEEEWCIKSVALGLSTGRINDCYTI